MSQNPGFLELLNAARPILSDGAMGTMLSQKGIPFDVCFDQLNLTQPAVVAEIHREYIEAGSQIIQTNTFGANRFKLAHAGLENAVEEINTAAVDLARRVISASYKTALIAGDIGPLGIRLAPFGRIQPEQACVVFGEQIAALAKAQVDLLIIETMTDLYEIQEAIRAARKVAPGLPVLASMTFTRDDRTLLGDDPVKVAKRIAAAGADVIGINCSGGPNQLLRILKHMRQAVPGAKYSIMPNAGWPEQVGGRIKYPANPDYFGEYALSFWEAGASVIGGCCGTTPRHIHAMSQAIQNAPLDHITTGFNVSAPKSEEDLPSSLQPTRLSQKLADKQFVVAVELDPPRGLSTHKMLAAASLLVEAGADVIDVADSPMARMRMSPWAVCSLVQRAFNIETVLHFPTRGRNLLRVQGDLLASHALDVRNVFVVMGDPTSIGDYPNAMDNFDLVPSGLIKLIKQGFNLGVDHSGSNIGQPTQFFVGCALNLNPPNMQAEIKNLCKKMEAGADFILTQPIYDPALVSSFLETFQKQCGTLTTPMLVGILPLASARHAAFLNHEVPGIVIPEAMIERMKQAGENGARAGIKIAIELISQIRPFVQGVYIMPAFNRFDYAAEIIEAVKLG
ncbi:MAG TPA: bifunctional homocysteine S-methyltransferase/methylenetetrahydrofolate reductase, partial [Anaerolineaceae bacterium]|nr:bifunctional homocysteine S-methyltransferase/methylenetetrahydrofolate reductase [Anaerolineaceae bacterium]